MKTKKKKKSAKGPQPTVSNKDKQRAEKPKQEKTVSDKNRRRPDFGRGRDNRRMQGPPPSQPTGLKEFRPRNPDKRPKNSPNNRGDKSQFKGNNSDN